MIVEDASFKKVRTVLHTDEGTATYYARFQGTVRMSETFWSAMGRRWDSWLGVVGGLIAVATFLYGIALWIIARGLGSIRGAKGGSDAAQFHPSEPSDADDTAGIEQASET